MWKEQRFEALPFLIVDDSADDLMLLDRALLRARVRHSRQIARSGDQAIAHLRRSLEIHGEPFPVVMFLDLLMPRVNGIEVLKWLRDHPHPPMAIVLHTGVEDDALLAQARELGANYFLPKGARPDAIAEVFRRAHAEWEQVQLVER